MKWAECRKCGQRGDQPPGLRLEAYPLLEAVFVGEEHIETPQKLVCRACGYAEPVPAGSINVIKPRKEGGS
jgi:hypothetical protein